MIYRGKFYLGTDTCTKLPEIIAIKLLAVVYSQFSRYPEPTNDVLLKEFLYRARGYVCQWLILDPFGEVVDCYYRKFAVALSCWERAN